MAGVQAEMDMIVAKSARAKLCTAMGPGYGRVSPTLTTSGFSDGQKATCLGWTRWRGTCTGSAA